MKIVIIQPLLPKYLITFLNRLVESSPHDEWVVFADIETKNSLNQYSASAAKFCVVNLRQVEIRGLTFRPGIFSAIRAVQPDVVVFNANPRDLSQLAMMVVMRLVGRRFYAWGMFHRIGGTRAVSRAYYRLSSWLANGAWTYSRTGARTLVELGVPKSKIRVIGTAIDENVPFSHRSQVGAEALSALRDKYELQDKKVILQVVRLSRIKKPQMLVEAAGILLSSRDDVVFVVIGDGEMRADLEELVANKGIGNAFRFLGAVYDEGVLAKWYVAASVFVVPTCIGLSAHHAMCYGLPVVTDNSLDEQASEFDILAEGLNSLLYDEGDAESLARVLARMLDDEELRTFLGNAAEKTIVNMHNVGNKVRRLLASLYGS